MPAGIQNQASEVLAQNTSTSVERFIDLRCIWREWGDSNEIILDCGGRWDRKLGVYVDDGEACLELRFQPAQYDAAYWFAGWLGEYLAGEARSEDYYRRWTMLNAGGRRGGKTDFCVKAQVALCAARDGSIAWAVSPTEDETIELHDVFSQLIPPAWADYRESKYRWYWANGSVLEYRSGFKPKSLKRGRVDLPFFNEAQYFPKRAYTMVRAPIADRSGMVLLAANPPDEPIGQWLLEFYDECKAGKETAALFEFDAAKNPIPNTQALEDMRDDLGEDDYRREVGGEFLPIGDRVWYAWSPKYNIRPVGEIAARTHGVSPIALPDITEEVTRRALGRPFRAVVGMDFQLTPHMAAAGCRFIRNPDDPARPHIWFDYDLAVEGTEDEFAEVVLETYDPATTALIVDASGWWQDSERTKGRGSVDMLKDAGFKFIYRPDRKSKKNPHIFERVQATNALMCSKSRVRRLFSVPENRDLNRAFKSWENKHGVPNRRSEFAHFSDAGSYVVWRFFPRKTKRRQGAEYRQVQRKRTKRERDLDNI